MQDWNVVISVSGQGYHQAQWLMKGFGKVSRNQSLWSRADRVCYTILHIDR